MDLDVEYQSLLGDQNILNDELELVNDAETQKDEYDRFSDEISQIRHDAVKIGGRITTKESEIKQLEAEILNIDVKIKQHYDNEQKIKDNERYNSEIQDCITEMNELNTEKCDNGQCSPIDDLRNGVGKPGNESRYMN